MRRLAAALLCVIVLLTAAPASARVPVYWPGPPHGRWDIDPTYRHRIPVIDLMKGELHRRQRREWIHERNVALRQWNRCSGGPKMVIASPSRVDDPKTIRLFRDPSIEGYAYGGWDGDSGFAAFNEHWTRKADVIAHEVGHALGFGHTNNNWSVMGNSAWGVFREPGQWVAPIDCRGLRHYYGRR